MKVEENISRREFFRTCGRAAVAGALSALTAIMWKQGRNKLPNQKCKNQGICSKCIIFDKCELPQALSVKRVQKHG